MGQQRLSTTYSFQKTAKEKIELEKKYEQGKLTEKDYQLQKFALKNKYKFAGFTNKRRFMYAIGLPVSLLSCSLLFLTSSFYISEKKTKTAFRIASFPFLIVSIYFILWTCWAYKTSHDFPVQAYYTILIVSSLLIGLSLDKIITVIHSNQHKIKDLILLTFRIRDKHYIDIAVKAKYAEQYNKALSDTKTVKQHADELDKDIDKTFNQLL